MEIKTCEQYVLAKLEEAEAKLEDLKDSQKTIEDLTAEKEALTAENDALIKNKSELEQQNQYFNTVIELLKSAMILDKDQMILYCNARVPEGQIFDILAPLFLRVPDVVDVEAKEAEAPKAEAKAEAKAPAKKKTTKSKKAA